MSCILVYCKERLFFGRVRISSGYRFVERMGRETSLKSSKLEGVNRVVECTKKKEVESQETVRALINMSARYFGLNMYWILDFCPGQTILRTSLANEIMLG